MYKKIHHLHVCICTERGKTIDTVETENHEQCRLESEPQEEQYDQGVHCVAFTQHIEKVLNHKRRNFIQIKS